MMHQKGRRFWKKWFIWELKVFCYCNTSCTETPKNKIKQIHPNPTPLKLTLHFTEKVSYYKSYPNVLAKNCFFIKSIVRPFFFKIFLYLNHIWIKQSTWNFHHNYIVISHCHCGPMFIYDLLKWTSFCILQTNEKNAFLSLLNAFRCKESMPAHI